MGKKIIKEISAWLPVALWAALIFHFSSGRIPVASTVYWQDFTIKKFGHVLLFGALAVLIYRGLILDGISRKQAAICAILFATFYGGTDEFHQMFTQGRESTVRDIFIDSGGATLAILIIYNSISRFPKKLQSFLLELGFK